MEQAAEPNHKFADRTRRKMSKINYVYIDESGDLGRYGSKYFTVAAIVVSDPIILRRIIKKLRQRKLKKSIKQLPEIKANNSNRIIREFILRKIKEFDCRIFSVVVCKENILNHLFQAQNKLYNYLCGILLEKIGINDGEIIITIDKKHTNTLIRKDFEDYVKNKLSKSQKDVRIEVYQKPSYSNSELQVVDFVCWSISRKFNSDDDCYYKIIENKVINKEDILLWKTEKQ